MCVCRALPGPAGKESRMKRILSIIAIGLLASLAAALARAAPAPAAAPPAIPPRAAAGGGGKLVVHEWGTFTGFAASSGMHLPFGVDVGAGLPEFVVTRSNQAVRLDARKKDF